MARGPAGQLLDDADEKDLYDYDAMSEGEKAFEIKVMCKLLEMHGMPPCYDLEQGEQQLAQVFRQCYDSYSQVQKVIDRAFEMVTPESNLEAREGFVVPEKLGVLKIRTLARNYDMRSEDDKQKVLERNEDHGLEAKILAQC